MAILLVPKLLWSPLDERMRLAEYVEFSKVTMAPRRVRPAVCKLISRSVESAEKYHVAALRGQARERERVD
jgi:hypothetical protein